MFMDSHENQSLEGEKEVLELLNEKKHHLETAFLLEKNMTEIQRSSRVEFSIFSRFHDYLRMKFGWYYNWHRYWQADIIHYLILVICMLFVTFLILSAK